VLPIAVGATVTAMALGGVSLALTGNDGPATNPAAAAGKSQPDRETLEKRASRSKTRATQSTAPQSDDAQSSTDDSVQSVPTGDSGTCTVGYTSTGSVTASGQKFDKDALTAANLSLPFGTRVQITNASTGRSVVVKVNDRGPYSGDRCFDLTSGAYAKIASMSDDATKVNYQVLD